MLIVKSQIMRAGRVLIEYRAGTLQPELILLSPATLIYFFGWSFGRIRFLVENNQLLRAAAAEDVRSKLKDG
jgi:hypothetical protein